MRRGLHAGSIALSVAIVTSACWDGSAPTEPTRAVDPRFVLVEDEARLATRVTRHLDDLVIDASVLGGGPDVEGAVVPAQTSASFTLVAEVDPPVVSGQSLEATHVSLTGNRAYVSYGKRGSAALGAIDVFDVSDPFNPVLKASARFDDTDIFTISAVGNALFCGETTTDPSFAASAVIERVDLAGGRMSQSTARSALTSFATTGVDVHGDRLFVTTGDGGGMSVLDARTLDVLETDDFADARDVQREGAWLAAVQGTPGRLRIYDSGTFGLTHVVDIGGLTIPESKAGVVIDHGYAFVAAGDGGTAVVDMRTATVVARVARPLVSGVPAEYTVTNAVTVVGNLLLHANGGAGVWVTETKHLQADPTVRPLGRMVFADGGSANFVAARGKMLFVAGGEGGLKIVRIST